MRNDSTDAYQHQASKAWQEHLRVYGYGRPNSFISRWARRRGMNIIQQDAYVSKSWPNRPAEAYRSIHAYDSRTGMILNFYWWGSCPNEWWCKS